MNATANWLKPRADGGGWLLAVYIGFRHDLRDNRQTGWLDRAIPLYEQTLVDRRRLLGPDHPRTLRSSNYLAACYHETGRLAEAIPLYERALAGWRGLLGPDHPRTLRFSNNLAGAYCEAGRLAEAFILYEETLARCALALGNDHIVTRRVRRNLSVTQELTAGLNDPGFYRRESDRVSTTSSRPTAADRGYSGQPPAADCQRLSAWISAVAL